MNRIVIAYDNVRSMASERGRTENKCSGLANLRTKVSATDLQVAHNDMERTWIYTGFLLMVFFGSCDKATKKEQRQVFMEEVPMDSGSTIPVDRELGRLHRVSDILIGNPVFKPFANRLVASASMGHFNTVTNVTLFIPLAMDELAPMDTTGAVLNRSLPEGMPWWFRFTVPKTVTKADLVALLPQEERSATLETLANTQLRLYQRGTTIYVEMEKRTYELAIADQHAVNGVVHGLREIAP